MPELTETASAQEGETSARQLQQAPPETSGRSSTHSSRAPLKVNSLRMNTESLAVPRPSADGAVAREGGASPRPARSSFDRWRSAMAAVRSGGLSRSPPRGKVHAAAVVASAVASAPPQPAAAPGPFSLFRVFSRRRSAEPDPPSPAAAARVAAAAAVARSAAARAAPEDVTRDDTFPAERAAQLPAAPPRERLARPGRLEPGRGASTGGGPHVLKTTDATKRLESPRWQTAPTPTATALAHRPQASYPPLPAARHMSRLQSIAAADAKSRVNLGLAQHATAEQAQQILRAFSQRQRDRLQRPVVRHRTLQ